MTILAHISGLFRQEIGDALYSDLLRAYPEGRGGSAEVV